MFPYSYTPYRTPAYIVPNYSYATPSYSQPDAEYLQAVAEEEAARRQYAEALRAQEEARNRAARARLARQAYESGRNPYISDEDDEANFAPDFGYGIPRTRRTSFNYPAADRQRLAAIERERERERERIRVLEENRRMRLLEEERKRRMMLEEEERQRRIKEAEEQRRLEEDLMRRQSSSTFSPLEDIFGLRPPRMAQSNSDGQSARRARTMSPAQHTRTRSKQADRSASRSPPTVTRIPISTPTPVERTPSRPPVERVPINVERTQPRAQSPPAKRPRSSSPVPSAREVDAAIKIQTAWREYYGRRTALNTITELATKFESLKSSFALPTSLDYVLQNPGSPSRQHVSVPVTGVDSQQDLPEVDIEAISDVPKLAYTPTNAPVHLYEEELNRILTKLDGVQSGGDEEVRQRRRELARKVEREAERVEKVKALVWRSWAEKQKRQSEEMVTEDVPLAEVHGGESQPLAEEQTMEVDVSVDSVSESSHPLTEASVIASGEDNAAPVPPDQASLPEHMEVEEGPTSSSTPTTSAEVITEDAQEPHAQTTVDPPSSLPSLFADHHSDGEDSEPRTPIAAPSQPELEVCMTDDQDSHITISQPPLDTKVSAEPNLSSSKPEDAAAPSQLAPMSVNALDLIRPLVSQDWDEECDFF